MLTARKLLPLLVLLTSSLLAQPAKAVHPPSASMPANQSADKPDWWKHGVFYEIYPRSFGDSNNDGTGDLNGITAHLDYLKALGIDAIWITPCFPSPQVDFGYDVSDYRAIDPQYGTLADMDKLIAEGKKRGIKVILDFVVNHTSDKHEWFKQSSSSKDNPYRDFYIWRDGKAPGKPPNNWTSTFGGPSWKYFSNTNQWYYHYFYPEQPDLNWRNPKVEAAMFDVARFWFNKGIYGFRLDAVDTMFEDPALKDNPPAEGTDAYGEPRQKHIYDKNLLPEVHAELQKLRKVADEFSGRVLIGETWTDTPEQLAAYYGPTNNELQMPMYFNFMMVNKLSPTIFRQRVDAIEHNHSGGWPVYVLSNHDNIRYANRYGDGKHNTEIAKMMATMLLTLRGSAILYYGDELGMENNDPKRREDVKDIIGQKGWPQVKGRDGERTPMQWTPGVNAGFNKGAKPWLPVAANHTTLNAATEAQRPGSVLNWYRKLIALRRSDPSLVDGSYTPLDAKNDKVYSYARKSGDRTVVVSLNMTAEPQTVSLAEEAGGSKGKVLASTSAPRSVDLGKLALDPFQAIVVEVLK
jgi:alpha-glucosidase